MKNFLINENEKNEILRKHEDLKKSLTETVSNRIKSVSNFRKTLSEQSDPIFIDNRTAEQVMKDCVTDPSVKANLYIWGKDRKPAIKVNGGPDNIRIYTNEPNKNFGGYNYYVLNTAETKILKGPFKWSCPAKPKVDQNAVDMKTDFGREVATGNWTDRKDINIPDSELVQTYEQHPKHKNLWKKKAAVNKSSGFTPDQQAFVDFWTGSTDEMKAKFSINAYKYNPTHADFASGQWTRDNYFIAPGSKEYFPADDKGEKGLKIFINANKLDKKVSRENCRAAIKTFVTMFKQSRGGKEPEAHVFADTKALVRLCNETMRFGGLFSKVDDDLKLLSGQTVDGYKGPSSAPQKNEIRFRINQK